MVEVDLGKNIKYDELEKILLEAAKEIGLEGKPSDEYNKIFRLNPVREEQTTYSRTFININNNKGDTLFSIPVDKYRNGYEHIGLMVYKNEDMTKKYLEAVSKQLNKVK